MKGRKNNNNNNVKTSPKRFFTGSGQGIMSISINVKRQVREDIDKGNPP